MPLNESIRENNFIIQQLFSFLVATLPIFATYASGIPGLSLADLLLVLSFVATVLRYYHWHKNCFTVRPTLILVAMYLIILFSLISLVTQRYPQYFSVAIRIIRYFFYLMVIGFCSTRILDIERCKHVIKTTSFLASLYIVLQFIAYSSSRFVLKGFLPFLKLYTEDYAVRDYQSVYASGIFRPTSFFLEPAHYARYTILGLILFLFNDDQVTMKQIAAGIFLSLGVLISTSSQGYLLLVLVWFLFFLIRRKDINDAAVKNLCLCAGLALPLIIFGILQLPFVQSTLARSLNIDISNKMTAVGARLGGIKYYLDLPFLYKFFGMGFGVIPAHSWMSSAVYWLYGSGLVVFILYCIYGLKCIFNLTGSAKIIVVVFLLLFITDDCFYSYMCIIFLSVSLLQPVPVIRSDGVDK